MLASVLEGGCSLCLQLTACNLIVLFFVVKIKSYSLKTESKQRKIGADNIMYTQQQKQKQEDSI